MDRRLVSARILFPAIIGIGILGMLTALQRQMIYHPLVADETVLLGEAARLGLQPWRNGSGELIGWHSVQKMPVRRRMLVFHGNAGFALHRDYYVNGLQALGEGWDVYLFEYPGYGARPGLPSSAVIKSTAERALRLLLSHDDSPVYLLGESLGSGVASHLAAVFPDQVAGVLLVTPFSTLADVAGHHFWFLPVRLLLSEQYDSISDLDLYRGPVAFLLAGEDEVVPKVFGQRLYDHYNGPKWLREIPGAGHNTLPLRPGADWWREAAGFLRNHAE